MQIKKDPKRPLLVVKGRVVRYRKDFYMGDNSTIGDITWVGWSEQKPPAPPLIISFVTTYNFFAEITTEPEHVSMRKRPSGRIVWCVDDFDDWIEQRIDLPLPWSRL